MIGGFKASKLRGMSEVIKNPLLIPKEMPSQIEVGREELPLNPAALPS